MKSYSRWLQIIILFLLSLTLGTAFAADPPALTGSPSAEIHQEANRMVLFVEELDLARERAMVIR